MGRARVRRLPPPQRQRRAHGPRVDPRGRAARRVRSAITNTHSVGVGARCVRCPRDRPPTQRRRAVVPAGRRRDVGRAAQRHRRPPRAASARRRGRSRPRRGAPSPRATSGAGPAWCATSSRAGSGPRPAWQPKTPVAGRSASWSRRTTANATSSASMACPSASAIPVGDVPSPYDAAAVIDEARAVTERGQRSPAVEPGAGRSSSSSRRTRRSCPTNASAWRSGRRLGLARMGSTANHSSGDLVLAFATGNRGLSTTDEPGASAPGGDRRPDGARQPDDAAVQGDGRGDRGGRRQRPARGRRR